MRVCTMWDRSNTFLFTQEHCCHPSPFSFVGKTKHYLSSSAFNKKFFVLVSSFEFSFWLPCSNCIHPVLMTLIQPVADKPQACASGGVYQRHTHMHTPHPDPFPLLLCNLMHLKCFLLQLPSQARLPGPRGSAPQICPLPGWRRGQGRGGCIQPCEQNFASPAPRMLCAFALLREWTQSSGMQSLGDWMSWGGDVWVQGGGIRK